MAEKVGTETHAIVDKGLVAMFLRMSPEERLLANDNAARTIMELRNEFIRQQAEKRKSQRDT